MLWFQSKGIIFALSDLRILIINITRGHGIFFFLVLDAMAKKIVAMVATRTFWQLALTFSVLATNLGKYFMLKQLRGESFQKKFTFIFLMLFTLISQLQRLTKAISKEKIIGIIFLQTREFTNLFRTSIWLSFVNIW